MTNRAQRRQNTRQTQKTLRRLAKQNTRLGDVVITLDDLLSMNPQQRDVVSHLAQREAEFFETLEQARKFF